MLLKEFLGKETLTTQNYDLIEEIKIMYVLRFVCIFKNMNAFLFTV